MIGRASVILAFAVAVWAFCGALVGIGRRSMSMDATLILHAIGAPIGAAILSWFSFKNYAFTGPLVTAAVFVATALILDVVVVALLIEKSFGMFQSVLGVWLPQLLIADAAVFAATQTSAAHFHTATPNRRHRLDHRELG